MVLLDTGTPGTSREIYSEDADVIQGLRVRVSPSADLNIVSLKTGN